MDAKNPFEILIEPALRKNGFFCIQSKVYQNHGQKVVQVMVERLDENQITFPDCKKVTKLIQELLEVQDPIGGDYNLEITSAGVERPLLTTKDFRKYQGFLAKIILKTKIENHRHFCGKIESSNSETVSLQERKSEKTYILPYTNIREAHLLMEEDVQELIEKENKL